MPKKIGKQPPLKLESESCNSNPIIEDKPLIQGQHATDQPGKTHMLESRAQWGPIGGPTGPANLMPGNALILIWLLHADQGTKISAGYVCHTCGRLQLKRGLFWYRHHPKLHQMVKYGSSRALVRTIRRQITLRVFFTLKQLRKMTVWSNKNQNC